MLNGLFVCLKKKKKLNGLFVMQRNELNLAYTLLFNLVNEIGCTLFLV